MALPNTYLLITVSIFSCLIIRLEATEESFLLSVNRDDGLSSIQFKGKSNREAAFEEILKEASLSIKNGGLPKAVNAIKEGLEAAINLIASSSETANRAFVSATDKYCNNLEAAIKDIEGGLKTAQQLIIYAIEYPVYYSFNAAAGISNEIARNGIKSGLEFAEQGGTYVIDCLRAAESLAINGFKTNLAAGGKGLDAAQEVTKTGFEVVYVSLILAGRSAFRGLSENTRAAEQKPALNRTSTFSKEAIAAKDAIILNAERAIKSLKPGPALNAIIKIKDSLNSGIIAVATGETTFLKAISITANLSTTEPEISLAVFEVGFKAFKVGIITAANITCQGLDEAGKIVGNQKIRKIISATIKVRSGITSALASIETAEKFAHTALKIGGEVAEQGLKAVQKSVSAAIFVLYSLLVTISEEVL